MFNSLRTPLLETELLCLPWTPRDSEAECCVVFVFLPAWPPASLRPTDDLCHSLLDTCDNSRSLFSIFAQLRCNLSHFGYRHQERSRYTAALDVVWTWYCPEPTGASSRRLLADRRRWHPSITEPGVRVLPRRLSLLIGACGFPDEQRRVCSLSLNNDSVADWFIEDNDGELHHGCNNVCVIGDVIVDDTAIAIVGTPRAVNYRASFEVGSNKLSVGVWSKCDDDRDEKRIHFTCMMTPPDDVIATFDLDPNFDIQGWKILQVPFDVSRSFLQIQGPNIIEPA